MNATVVPVRQQQIAAAVFGALTLAVLVWAGAFSSINGSLEAEIEAKSQILDGLRRRAGLPAVVRTGNGNTGFAVISAPTETVAASTLQQYLLDHLEQAGGTVQRVQAEPARDAKSDGMRRLTAEIGFDASSNAMQRLLFDLETGTPYVFVDTLSAQPAPASDSANPETNAELLRVSLVVSSYWSSREETTQK